MSKGFQEWLAEADEDDKRAASDFRHHFPVEQEYWELEAPPGLADAVADLIESGMFRRIVCGCEPKMGYPLGHETEDAR